VQLDIDNPVAEQAIVEQLFSDVSIRSLVDEFYFEHHVDVVDMRPSWGSPQGRVLKDTYDIMIALRRAGVRAHWWP